MKYKIGDKLRVKEGCKKVCNDYYYLEYEVDYIIITEVVDNTYIYNLYDRLDKKIDFCSCFKDEHLEYYDKPIRGDDINYFQNTQGSSKIDIVKHKDISDISTYEVGDVLVLENLEESGNIEQEVLGICGKVVFLSRLDEIDSYLDGLTIKEVMLTGYKFKDQDPEVQKAIKLLEDKGMKVSK